MPSLDRIEAPNFWVMNLDYYELVGAKTEFFKHLIFIQHARYFELVHDVGIL